MLTVYFRVRLLFGDVAVHVTCGGKTTQFANFSTAFSDLFEKNLAKGPLISKCLFDGSDSPQKTILTQILALAYWGRNFSFVFWRIEKTKMSFRN